VSGSARGSLPGWAGPPRTPGAALRPPAARWVLASVLLLFALLLVGCVEIREERSPEGEPQTTVATDEATGNRVQEVVEAVRPSLADVRAFESGGGLTRRGGAGAGVVLEPDGLIVTSHHVLTMGGEEVVGDLRVILDSGEEHRAELVGADPEADLALLRIDAEGLTPAEFLEDASALEEGDLVVALGSPGALDEDVSAGEFHRVIRGLRSPGLARLDSLIQVRMPLQQGNSGGPLADSEGRVVGLVMGKSPPDHEGPRTGYVIPAATVLEVVEEIRSR
jgi:S1-C subfamily serine protease